MCAVYLKKCRPNLEIRAWRVLPLFGFGSRLTRRSKFSACRTFSAFELHANYEFTPVWMARARYVHERVTHCHRQSLKKNPIVTCYARRARKFVVTYNVCCKHSITPNSGQNKLTFIALPHTYNRRASMNTVHYRSALSTASIR